MSTSTCMCGTSLRESPTLFKSSVAIPARHAIGETNDSDSWSIKCCKQCGLFTLWPRPAQADMAALYPLDYEPFWSEVSKERKLLLKWERRRHVALRCHAVKRAKPFGGQLLDVGCGTGGFMAALCADRSWHAVGQDIIAQAVQTACGAGLDARLGELAELRLPSNAFDAATMWEVIEHVPNPRATLAELLRVLKPGGALLLTTPNGRSMQARLWRKHWAGWDVPRHLHVFTIDTLCHWLSDAGFEVILPIHLPLERFYAVESGHRWLAGSNHSRFESIAHALLPLLGVAGWPILRAIDFMPCASGIGLLASAHK